MFWPDITTLQEFYESPLGEYLADEISCYINSRWKNCWEQEVVGLGYPLPYIDRMKAKNITFFSLMPGAQGAINWPEKKRNRSALIDECMLPLLPNSIDKIFVTHTLECCDNSNKLISEIFLSLKSGGKAILAFPNRKGLWAHMGDTPMRYGMPYHLNQIKQLAIHCQFQVLDARQLLFTPPSENMLQHKEYWDKYGKIIFKPFGSMIVIELEKKLFAMTPDSEKAGISMEPVAG